MNIENKTVLVIGSTDGVGRLVAADWPIRARASRFGIVARHTPTGQAWTCRGVLESQRTALIDPALQAQHGEAMKTLVVLERAIEITESAVQTGRDEVRHEMGLGTQTFDEGTAPLSKKSDYGLDGSAISSPPCGIGRSPQRWRAPIAYRST